MTLSAWQLIVVGALATIWVVVLGVPLIVDLLRWLRNRPPAPENEHVSTRHQVLGYIGQRWLERPRPLKAWKSQDAADRRWQVLLACAVATTMAMFLAIALRGLFVQLFLVTLAVSLLALAVAAYLSAAEQRNLSDQARTRLRNQAAQRLGLPAREEPAFDDAATEPFGGIETLRPPWLLESTEARRQAPDDRDRQAARMADRGLAQEPPDRSGFMFEPLNLDEGLPAPPRPERLVDDFDIEVPIDHELVAELGLPIPIDSEGERGDAAGFRAATEAGSRQASARARSNKRRKARPIYIESVLDEPDNPTKAVND